MKREEKAITLIVLIITIIVLLVLASITIMQLSKNELFDKLIFAKNKQINAQIKENSILEDYENEIDEYVGNTREEKLFSATELLSEPAIVPLAGGENKNMVFPLLDSIENYKYLLFTFGNYNPSINQLGSITTLLIDVEDVPNQSKQGPDYSYIIFQAESGVNYTSAEGLFKDNNNFYIFWAKASNTGRTHFAIKSIKGIK